MNSTVPMKGANKMWKIFAPITIIAAFVVLFGLPAFAEEGFSAMAPVGAYDSFPGRHIPRLFVGIDCFSISSHIASCVTIKSTLKQDKDTH